MKRYPLKQCYTETASRALTLPIQDRPHFRDDLLEIMRNISQRHWHHMFAAIILARELSRVEDACTLLMKT